MPPEVVHPWEPVSGPRERVHIEYAGPTDGHQYLIEMDAFSKWVEVVPTRTITSTWTANELRKLFSTLGYPDILISHNEGQFVSQEIKNFLENCGIMYSEIHR